MRSLLAALAALILLAAPAAAQDRVVNIYNWTDYIDPAVLKEFERETGIRVRYDVYDSNDLLETKLLAGKTGYDIVVPTSPYLARLIAAGVLGQLDKGKLPNLRHMDAGLMARLAKYDPGNAHAVIYLWGTSGIAVNADKVRAAMRNPPANSLRMLFDPDVVRHFADCGVAFLDAPDEMLPSVLKYLGEDPDSKDFKMWEKAEAALMRVRPYIRKFHSSQYINDLATGEICLAYGWSGDVLQAKARAEEAKNGVRVQYLLPREGAQQWFDAMAIPADAPNRDNAHAFMNYLMNPRVIARITNAVQYPNGNKDSLPFVLPEAREDPDVFPPPAAVKTLYTTTPLNQAQQRQLNRLWQRVKGG